MAQAETKETPQEAPQVIEPGSVSPSSLEAEIAAGVDDLLKKRAEEFGGEVPDDHVEAVAEDGQSPKGDPEGAEESKESEGEPKGLSNAAVERAVLAGLSLDEVNKYTDEALLEAMCARIEGFKGEVGSQDGADAGDHDGRSVEDLLAAIPDLDPEDYEEPLVEGFKSLKEIIKQQRAEIDELRGGRTTDWFSTQLEGVKDLTKGDAGKTSALKVKYDVLKAGYTAAGQDVTDQAIFDEAAKLVLSSEMEAARQKKKGNAARNRSGQFASRPSGNRVKAQPDARTEIAAAIDAKFFS